MKFLAVFAALFAVACAQNTWTLQQLSDAIQSPHTDEALKPHLEAALDQMMSSLWAGEQIESTVVTISATGGTEMTLQQLSEALQNPETDPELIPVLEALLNQIMEALISGHPVESAVIGTPAMEIHHYTIHELSNALQNPDTNAELVPHLEHALNTLMEAVFAGEDMTSIVIAVPAGLIPVEADVSPAPAEEVAPEAPGAVDPVVPDVPATAVPSSPLVQIIVNVNA